MISNLKFDRSTRVIWSMAITVSLLFHLFSAYLGKGYHHCDEHFQILEFATIKLDFAVHNIRHLPWEYDEQIRSSIQPYLVVLVAKILHLSNNYNPFLCSLILRTASSLFGWSATVFWCSELLKVLTSKDARIFLLLITFSLWFLPYIDSRFSSESLSGSFFLLALALHYRAQRVQTQTLALNLLTGMALGFSFLFRFQLGILILVFACWYIFQYGFHYKEMLMITGGLVFILLLGTLLDYFFYKEFVLTPWLYFRANLIYDASSSFGVSPWWEYFRILYFKLISPISTVLLIAIILSIINQPRSLYTWLIFFFFVLHCLIGHKELRFLFPLAHLIPGALTISFSRFLPQYTNHWFTQFAIWMFVVINIALAALSVPYPKSEYNNVYRYIWNSAEKNGNVTLYYNKKNPYEDAKLNMNYYKPVNLTLIRLEDSEGTRAVVEQQHKDQVLLFSLKKISQYNESELFFDNGYLYLFELSNKR
jgi:phosphatidylinositol glycan class B